MKAATETPDTARPPQIQVVSSGRSKKRSHTATTTASAANPRAVADMISDPLHPCHEASDAHEAAAARTPVHWYAVRASPLERPVPITPRTAVAASANVGQPSPIPKAAAIRSAFPASTHALLRRRTPVAMDSAPNAAAVSGPVPLLRPKTRAKAATTWAATSGGMSQRRNGSDAASRCWLDAMRCDTSTMGAATTAKRHGWSSIDQGDTAAIPTVTRP